MMSDTLRKCIKLMFLFLKKTAYKSEEFINPFPSAIPIKEFNNIRKFIVLSLHISDIFRYICSRQSVYVPGKPKI